MQHEALSVDLDADPFDVPVYRRVGHVDREHISSDGFRFIRLEEGIVVKVAKRSSRDIASACIRRDDTTKVETD